MFSTACTEGPCTHCVIAAVHLWEAKGTAGIAGRARFSGTYGNRGYRNSCTATRIFTRLLNKQKQVFVCPISLSKQYKRTLGFHLVWKNLLKAENNLCLKKINVSVVAIKLTLVMLYFLIYTMGFYHQSNTSMIPYIVHAVLDSNGTKKMVLAFWFTKLCLKLRGLKELSNIY